MMLWNDEEEDILIQITNEAKFAGLQDESKSILFPTKKIYRQVCSALENQGYSRTVNAINMHWNIIVRSRFQHQSKSDSPWNTFEQKTLTQMTDALVAIHSNDPATILWAKHWRDVSEKLVSLGHHRVPTACFAYWYSTHTDFPDYSHGREWRKDRNSKTPTQQAQKRPKWTWVTPLTKPKSKRSRHNFTKEHKALLIQALGPQRTDHLPSQEVIDDLAIRTGHNAKSVKDSLVNHRRYRQPPSKKKDQYVKKYQKFGASNEDNTTSSNMHPSTPNLSPYPPMFDTQSPVQYQSQYTTLANAQSQAPYSSSYDTSMPNMHSPVLYQSEYTNLINNQPPSSYTGSYASMSQQANERMQQEYSSSFNKTPFLSNGQIHYSSFTSRQYSTHSTQPDYVLPQFGPRDADYGKHDPASSGGPSRGSNNQSSADLTIGMSNSLMFGSAKSGGGYGSVHLRPNPSRLFNSTNLVTRPTTISKESSDNEA